jgi:hypothetical protein
MYIDHSQPGELIRSEQCALRLGPLKVPLISLACTGTRSFYNKPQGLLVILL